MLKPLNEKYFNEVYEILINSFDRDEIRDKTGQKKILKEAEYQLLGELSQSNKLLGIMAIWDFDEFRYIEHFAVCEESRNRGLGGELLQQLMDETKKPIILEVEPLEDEIKKRRIEFYRRKGFKLNPYEYVQLPLAEGRNPVPLKIMSFPKALTSEEYEKIRDKIYNKIFGISASNNNI